MLDYRLKTFLLLSKTLNYTKTAQQLHMSQPAVSQHIRYLEQTYNIKLFEYYNRRLQLTEMGQRFYQQVLALEVQSQDIIERLRQEQENRRLYLHFRRIHHAATDLPVDERKSKHRAVHADSGNCRLPGSAGSGRN